LIKLNIKFKATRNPIDFPYQDISKNIKFQLKELKFKFNHKSESNFLNFFQTQASSLEILDVKSSNEEFLEILFNKCKNLTKLTFYGKNSQIYSNLYLHMKNVKILTDYSFSNLNLHLIYQNFPNILHLKCFNLVDTNGIFEKLYKLEINSIKIANFQNLKFTNLKILLIKSLEKIEVESHWIKFIQNVPNVEIFKINFFKCKTDREIILKFLRNFLNLKNFEIWYSIEYEIQSNSFGREVINYLYEDPVPHNMLIDFEKKTIKSDNSKLNKEILRGQFQDFTFFNYDNFKNSSNFKNLYLRPFESDSDY
jgi:hypothetical protein